MFCLHRHCHPQRTLAINCYRTSILNYGCFTDILLLLFKKKNYFLSHVTIVWVNGSGRAERRLHSWFCRLWNVEKQQQQQQEKKMVWQLNLWSWIIGCKVAVAVSGQWDTNLFNQTWHDYNSHQRGKIIKLKNKKFCLRSQFILEPVGGRRKLHTEPHFAFLCSFILWLL